MLMSVSVKTALIMKLHMKPTRTRKLMKYTVATKGISLTSGRTTVDHESKVVNWTIVTSERPSEPKKSSSGAPASCSKKRARSLSRSMPWPKTSVPTTA